MKKTLAVSLMLLFAITTIAFGHAGEVHSMMGTVTTIHSDGSFMLSRTDGTTMHVAVASTTSFVHADGKAAAAADLAAGSRVVVKISKDGKTALSVKMAAAKK